VEFVALDEIEIAGPVTAIESEVEFTVDSQKVVTNPETVFVNGSPENIVLGAFVEVKGRLNDGWLDAEQIIFELETE
jgi:hypothetical protein